MGTIGSFDLSKFTTPDSGERCHKRLKPLPVN